MICENEIDAGSVTLCAAAAAAILPRVAGRDKADTESDMARQLDNARRNSHRVNPRKQNEQRYRRVLV